jgi:hypothetical protein
MNHLFRQALSASFRHYRLLTHVRSEGEITRGRQKLCFVPSLGCVLFACTTCNIIRLNRPGRVNWRTTYRIYTACRFWLLWRHISPFVFQKQYGAHSCFVFRKRQVRSSARMLVIVTAFFLGFPPKTNLKDNNFVTYYVYKRYRKNKRFEHWFYIKFCHATRRVSYCISETYF